VRVCSSLFCANVRVHAFMLRVWLSRTLSCSCSCCPSTPLHPQWLHIWPDGIPWVFLHRRRVLDWCMFGVGLVPLAALFYACVFWKQGCAVEECVSVCATGGFVCKCVRSV